MHDENGVCLVLAAHGTIGNPVHRQDIAIFGGNVVLGEGVIVLLSDLLDVLETVIKVTNVGSNSLLKPKLSKGSVHNLAKETLVRSGNL